MNGTLAWIAIYTAVICAGVAAIVAGMHMTRRIDSRPADELHMFDRPPPTGAPRHVLDQGCWCLPDVQHRDGTAFVTHHVQDEGDHP